jgi:polysaccharide deacetylase family protein (PEP-CTERM system associated)
MQNILTVNIEECDGRNTLKEDVRRLLALLAMRDATATFFFPGIVAENHPDIVKEIFAGGHEIGSRGYGSRPVCRSSHTDFESDIIKSIMLLSKITGGNIFGYRAPVWSITQKSAWALPILKNNGFQYDSSMYPQANFSYSMKKCPRLPSYINTGRNREELFLEVPPSALRVLDYNFAFSGDFLRRCPRQWLLSQIQEFHDRDNPAVFFVRPHQFDLYQDRLDDLLQESETVSVASFFDLNAKSY